MPTLSALSQRQKEKSSLLESLLICASGTSSATYCVAAHATHQEFFWYNLLSAKMTEAKTYFLIYKQKPFNLLKSKFMPPSIAYLCFFRWQMNCSWEMRRQTAEQSLCFGLCKDTAVPVRSAECCKKWIAMHRADVKETHNRTELSPSVSSRRSSGGSLGCPCWVSAPRQEQRGLSLLLVWESGAGSQATQVQPQSITARVT